MCVCVHVGVRQAAIVVGTHHSCLGVASGNRVRPNPLAPRHQLAQTGLNEPNWAWHGARTPDPGYADTKPARATCVHSYSLPSAIHFRIGWGGHFEPCSFASAQTVGKPCLGAAWSECVCVLASHIHRRWSQVVTFIRVSSERHCRMDWSAIGLAHRLTISSHRTRPSK